jgi:nicotinamide phosphoribosyltransferase
MYPKGTNKIYSYMCARGSRVPGVDKTVFFGLTYYLKKYLMEPITQKDKDQFIKYVSANLGPEAVSPKILKDIDQLIEWGYLPLEVRAMPEGSELPLKVPYFTITNTHDDFFWLTNYVESLLSKCWDSCTAATTALRLRRLAEKYSDLTCDDNNHVDYQFHLFAYRGMSSEETAAITGAAHLLSFKGTDSIISLPFIDEFYGEWVGSASCAASEHSVHCSFGREHEFESYENLLEEYPTGILSAVSDSYNYWEVLTNFLPRFKDKIMSRDGKYVVRPDSAPKTPLEMICGDPEADPNSPEFLGSLEILWGLFGGTYNDKNYRVLDPHIGLIYGDAITYQMADNIFKRMEEMGFASSNVVFGCGSWTYQYVTRDSYNHAVKCTYVEIDGEPREVFKDPATGSFKKSAKGLLAVYKDTNDEFYLKDQCTSAEESSSDNLLKVVFRDGVLYNQQTFYEIRERLHAI